MDMSSAPSHPVPNQGTVEGPSNPDRTLSTIGPFSWTPWMSSLLLVAGFSVSLGLLPYFRLRHHILSQKRVLGDIRVELRQGNDRTAEYWKRRDIETSARQIQDQKQNEDLKMRLQLLEEKYAAMWSSSNQQAKVIQSLRQELDGTVAKNKELEGLLDGVRRGMGGTLGQMAAFIEEWQRKNGEQSEDRFGADKMRAFALFLQRWRRNTPGSETPPDTTSNTSTRSS